MRRIELAVVWDLDKPGIYFLEEVERGLRRLHPRRILEACSW
jgi:hypothetical protein